MVLTLVSHQQRSVIVFFSDTHYFQSKPNDDKFFKHSEACICARLYAFQGNNEYANDE